MVNEKCVKKTKCNPIKAKGNAISSEIKNILLQAVQRGGQIEKS